MKKFLHNSAGEICVWVKAISNDFSANPLRASSLPVRYVLFSVNDLKYFLNLTRKKSFNMFLVLLRLPLQRGKFWTLPIGSEPSMQVANSHVANLTGGKTGIKLLVTTPLRYDLCLLPVYRKYDDIIMISSLIVGAIL